MSTLETLLATLFMDTLSKTNHWVMSQPFYKELDRH